MRRLFYMGIEPLKSRYTLQLQDWSEQVFKAEGIDYKIVGGLEIDNTKSIQVGQVLDAHGRSYYSMSQMMNLVQMMRNGEVTGKDAIFFEDMFTPGIESLGYIMNQIPTEDRPQIYVRCLAQRVDPDDFVHVWGMEWMDHYESMVNAMPNMHILATNEEMVAHMKIAKWKAPIYNISGLAFGKDEVQSRVDNKLIPFRDKKMRVCFAARTDQEKQPHFYLDLILDWYTKYPNSTTEFAIFSGGELRGNDQEAIDRIRSYEKKGLIVVYENLEKNEYYDLLNDSRVIFNCALQDWTSNTVSEADALNTNVLYPAYRSFPETFANDAERLYVPWSLDDALAKLEGLLLEPHKNMGLISNWNNGTIKRCLDIIEGTGEQWRRDDSDYRKYVNRAKYKLNN